MTICQDSVDGVTDPQMQSLTGETGMADRGMQSRTPQLVRPWPERFFRMLLVLAVFTLSWHIVRLGAVNLTASDMAFMACFAILLARGKLNPVPFGSLTNLWCLGLTLMLGSLLVSSIVTGQSARWLIVASQYLFAGLLLPMVLTSEDSGLARKCLVFYVLGVAASQVAGIGASYLLSFDEAYGIFGDSVLTGNGRIGALAGEPNWNGATVAFALPMLINAMRHRQMPALLGLPCAVALGWGLLASASFTGFSAAVMSVALMFAIASPRTFLTFGLPLIVAVGVYILAGLPLPGVFEERVGSALQSGELDKAGTFVGRASLVREAWEIANGTILLGLGVDGFRIASVHGAPVHLFPLLILTEGGILALAGVLLLIGTLFWLALRAMRIHRDDGAMALAAIVVFCIFSFAIPHMYTRLWFGPVILALAPGFSRPPRRAVRYAGPAPRSAEDRPMSPSVDRPMPGAGSV